MNHTEEYHEHIKIQQGVIEIEQRLSVGHVGRQTE